MSDMKIDAVRSSSSGVLGRARSEARGTGSSFDSSSRPQATPFTNSEAFLGGVSRVGHADRDAREGIGDSHDRINVTIEGARTAAEPNRFATITMTFEIARRQPGQADELADVSRALTLYRTVAGATR